MKNNNKNAMKESIKEIVNKNELTKRELILLLDELKEMLRTRGKEGVEQ